jgi:predicted component of type VI protein secretion system
MTPPPGRLDLTFDFAANGTTTKGRPAAGVGHVVFIAPYSGAAKSPTGNSDFVARPLEVGEAFRIVPSAIQLEPLTPGGAPFLLWFSDSDSLHPDALLETVPSLTELWELLRDLDGDPSAAASLIVMVDRIESAENGIAQEPEAKGASNREAARQTPAAPTSPEPAGDLLERLLGKPPGKSPQADVRQAEGVSVTAAQELVQQFAQRLLGEQSTAVRGEEASPDLRMKAKAKLAKRLRALLRQNVFQSVSGTWLATEMVVRSCPDDSRARFSAVDAAWAELVSAPKKFEALLEAGASVVVVDHCFGAEGDELRGLVELVRVCHDHKVFLVAGAAPSLAGLDDHFLQNPNAEQHDVETWQKDWSDKQRECWERLAALREEGAQFALALPRCLVRHPYGKQGEPLEAFDFEEFSEPTDSVQFLWANGAYLVARALMEQWCGGEAKMDGSYEISGLPVASVPDVDGRRMQPPIELSLPRAAVEQLLDQGFSVIEARRDSDRARVYV